MSREDYNGNAHERSNGLPSSATGPDPGAGTTRDGRGIEDGRVSEKLRDGNGNGDDSDDSLRGDSQGRGIGLAHGYPAHVLAPPPSPQPAKPQTQWLLAPYPALATAGAGDGDAYAGFDPGMAGCTTEQCPCSIPGVPLIGPAPLGHGRSSPLASHARGHGDGVATSRGYERDVDEYDEVESEGGHKDKGKGAEVTEDERREAPSLATPAPAPASADPDPNVDPNTNGNGNGNGHSASKPPIGSRIVGRVERLAGKVLRDPEIEARGVRHMTGHL